MPSIGSSIPNGLVGHGSGDGWSSGVEQWQPDQIIDHIFSLHKQFSPVLIGVELDGLHEVIMQPLRQEQLRRGTIVPIQGYKAPLGKLQFINSFAAILPFGRDYLRQGHPSDQQFLSFPTGKIDFPNALAYAVDAARAAVYCRAELRTLLQQQTRGLPSLQVSRTARWTLNAFAAGLRPRGHPAGHGRGGGHDGLYCVLMEGLESFIATAQAPGEEERDRRYAISTDGRRYLATCQDLPSPSGLGRASGGARGPTRREAS